MKQTAIEWLIVQIKNDHIQKALTGLEWKKIFDQAKAMEREQIVEIVEKSRATGLTAEYLILTLYGGEQ